MLKVTLVDLCEETTQEVVPILESNSYSIKHMCHDESGDIESNCDLIILAVKSLSHVTVQLIDRLLSFNIPVIVVCEECAIEVSMQMIRYGVVDCISLKGCLDTDLSSACLKATKFSVRRSKTDSFAITVISTNSTADASILSANIATAIAQFSGESRLVDLNFRGSEIPTYFGIIPDNNIQHLFVDKQDIDKHLIEKSIVRHSSGVQLISGPPTFATVELNELYHLDSILRQLSEDARMVVMIEDPAHIPLLTTLKDSRKAIITTQLNIVSLRKAKYYVDLLRQEGYQPNNIGAVTLEYAPSGEIPIKYASKLLGVEDFISLPIDFAEESMSLNLGVPTYIRLPSNKFSVAIKRHLNDLTGLNTESHCKQSPSSGFLSFCQSRMLRGLGSAKVTAGH